MHCFAFQFDQYAVLCVYACMYYVLHHVALSVSCRLLENSTILDQYERASLTYEKEERRFTLAWCWWWRDTLTRGYWIYVLWIYAQRWTWWTSWKYHSCSAVKIRKLCVSNQNLLRVPENIRMIDWHWLFILEFWMWDVGSILAIAILLTNNEIHVILKHVLFWDMDVLKSKLPMFAVLQFCHVWEKCLFQAKFKFNPITNKNIHEYCWKSHWQFT